MDNAMWWIFGVILGGTASSLGWFIFEMRLVRDLELENAELRALLRFGEKEREENNEARRDDL